jgi:hypothetical protein
MVKGNAERRKMLAERRKLESAEEKVRKTRGPLCATASEVRARLLSDARGSEAGLIAWVVCDGAVKNFCETYFRAGACPLKRCKASHLETISGLEGVPECTEDADASFPALHTLPLRMADAGDSLEYDRTIRMNVRRRCLVLCVVGRNGSRKTAHTVIYI